MVRGRGRSRGRGRGRGTLTLTLTLTLSLTSYPNPNPNQASEIQALREIGVEAGQGAYLQCIQWALLVISSAPEVTH